MDGPTLWAMAKPILAGQLRHSLTVAAGAAIAHGALQADQQDAFIQIGMGVAGWAAVAAWSWWNGVGKARVAALLNKLTDTKTVAAAVAVAKQMPPAAETGAAQPAKAAVGAVPAPK